MNLEQFKMMAELVDAYGPPTIKPKSCPQWKHDGFDFYVSNFNDELTIHVGHPALTPLWFREQKIKEGYPDPISYMSCKTLLELKKYISDNKQVIDLWRLDSWSDK